MPRVPPPPELEIGRLEEVFDHGAVKLLARHEELDPEKFWDEVESHIGHLVTTTWSSTGALVEISAAGVSKASTLELLCREKGVEASQVVAFGDLQADRLTASGAKLHEEAVWRLAVSQKEALRPRVD